ncbi:glycosyl hydrolase family 18 protein [uncultured Alistipes sp.]|uniref:glycosyl hydrolase family 18 protein n=1 Tax=uncultured Alistipes sp. TaxID=538949 RepID=UPI0025F97051|nr:glycosyl hydrolase family 18 protein [uncultured Alistipes sp.]
MKKTLKLMAALFVGAMFMGACQQAEEPAVEPGQTDAVVTRTYGDKTPKIAIYVETNDVNPLNAGDYVLPNGEPYADIVELFAANIHKRTVNGVTEPVLYLNDKMTNLMENGGYLNYIKPLQDKGIKVLLTVLGDWQGIGVANMNDTQATQFAQILAYTVERYGLDGIGFDDEYANYNTALVNGSFGNIILKLRNLMPEGKLITVFEFGNYGSSQINATAAEAIDYVYSNFGYNTYIGVYGLGKSQYAPLSINLGYYYSQVQINRYATNAWNAQNGGYGAIMHFNLRRTSDVDPTSLFDAIAYELWEDSVSVASTPSNAGDRPQDWTFVTGGHDITMDDVNAQ